MTPIITHYLNEEEKSILENFFIYNKHGSKQNYKKWIDGLFAQYKIQAPENSRSIFSAEYEINHIWDKDQNISLAQHIFAHKKFDPSSNKMRNFEKFHPDWSHLDNNNNNILHTIASHHPLFLPEATSDRMKQVINSEGKSYHILLIEKMNFDLLKVMPTNARHDWKVFSHIFFYHTTVCKTVSEFLDKKIYQLTDSKHLNNYIKRHYEYIDILSASFRNVSKEITKKALDELNDELKTLHTQISWLNMNTELSNEKHSVKKIKL